MQDTTEQMDVEVVETSEPPKESEVAGKVEPKKRVQRVTKPETQTAVVTLDQFEQLTKRVNSLVDAMGNLADAVLAGQQAESRSNEARPTSSKPAPVNKVSTDELPSSDMVVPPTWKAKMHEILGDGFDMLVYDSGNGNFVIDIYLPKELDRRVGYHEGRDHSSGLVRGPSALADVESWSRRILANIEKECKNYKK